MNFIQELFYGNISPYSRSISQNSEYEAALSTVIKNEKLLTENLAEPFKSQFLALIDAQTELNRITAYESFLDGFLLGANFVHDTFLTNHDRMLPPL